VGPRAVLDTVVKRKIPSPRWESNPRTPIVQPVAQSNEVPVAMSSGEKRQRSQADHSPPTAEVKNAVELYLHFPIHFMVRFLVKHRQLYFTLQNNLHCELLWRKTAGKCYIGKLIFTHDQSTRLAPMVGGTS
jgi:hypothetical protein